MKRGQKLTYAKADRALLAIVALIECDDISLGDVNELDKACDLIRALRDNAKR